MGCSWPPSMETEGRALCWGLRWLYPLVGAAAVAAMGVDALARPALVFAVYALLGFAASRRVMRLAQCAARDPLTGLWNRAEGLKALEVCLSEASRRRSPLAIFMIDLDLLKEINDGEGHLAGDAALRMVGETLRTTTRCSDVASRYGGDEFLLVTSCAPADALALSLRIRGQLRALGTKAGLRSAPTVSIGIAAAQPGGGGAVEARQLVELADAALYESKAAGRDGATLKCVPERQGGPAALDLRRQVAARVSRAPVVALRRREVSPWRSVKPKA